MIQVSPFVIRYTIDDEREEHSFWIVPIAIMIVHMMTAYLFKVYYLHNDLLGMNSSSVNDEKKATTENDVICY